jgi:excisionase family DNA binding protein
VANLLTYEQVADRLSCHVKTVRKLVKLKLLTAAKHYKGVGVRFTEEDVLRYIYSQTEPVKENSKGAKGS